VKLIGRMCFSAVFVAQCGQFIRADIAESMSILLIGGTAEIDNDQASRSCIGRNL
jgi:hypothetical protein